MKPIQRNELLGLAGRPPELDVWGCLGVVQAQVVRQHAKDVRRVLCPAWQTEVDLRYPAMPVEMQEVFQTGLEFRGKGAGKIDFRQSLRRRFTQSSGGVRVGARLSGELPECQVHLRRRVVRESAHGYSPLVVGGEVA